MDFVTPVQTLIPGASGRILAVLAETTAELNLRTLSRLSGVSLAQASRVMPRLVELGMVDRRDVPPTALFRLVEEHIASRVVVAVARSRTAVLDEMGRAAATTLTPPPVGVVVFGSLARGTADARSDIDVVVVRPAEVDDDDEAWHTSLEQWRQHARRLTGNSVDILEVAEADAMRLLRSRRPLWADIRHHGVVIFGQPLDQLAGRRSA
jgi:predicted nucleotidyltransferase